MLASGVYGANESVKVNQVTEGVTVTTDVDYTITGEEPFGPMGSVDIASTEHAVVIIQEIKPSRVIANWLDHIYIKGKKAVDGENCQVKMFGRGTIILPYDKDIRPLTCFTEADYGGHSCNDYTEGHDNGFMKTLTDENLNNRIRSFKLKRGYMVTFALGTGGWGYSRCFIADLEDLEMNLPENMAGKVSSYRLFKWQNAKKGNLASTDAKYCDLVNATSGFDWGEGHNMLPDVECVPNHIYEDWPPISTIGKATWSCHSKNNNEPGNSADDTPQDVETVLDNWQNVMRTGLRLCSESSHDGSMGHLQAFLDSIDARGWRCDIIDMHCYWTQNKFDELTQISVRYGNRPIWISEWLWGAWWNHNGIFALVEEKDFSENAQRLLYEGTRPILEKLNANPRVERYFYWNAEERTSLWSKDGADTLSMLGKYYAHMGEGLAFNREFEYTPKVVYRPSKDLTAETDIETRELTLRWNDPNGDMLDSMVVLCKRPGEKEYAPIGRVALQDANSAKGAAYTFTDMPENGTNQYRIAIYPVGKAAPDYSNTATALVISQKAVWNDVTNDYVANAGFDQSADYQKANLGTGTSNHKAVTGWTTDCNEANGCSAAFEIGGGKQLNGKTVPATNARGDVYGGALGMNQGWEVAISYGQTVSLPAGTYRLSYAVYNAGNTPETSSLCGYQIGSQPAVYDHRTSVEPGSWQIVTLNPFTLMEESEVTLSLGYTAAWGKSTGNPYLFFDYVKLEQADLSQVDDAGVEIVYQDVTDSIFLNPGFDIATDFQKSNLAKGTGNHKAATGWTTTCRDANGASGVFAVGSNFTLNGQHVPSAGQGGEATGGALGISQGWGQDNHYTQSVTLPEGTYRMSYAVYNAANPSAAFNSRCGYQIDGQTAVYDGLSQLPIGAWQVNALEEFTLDKETQVSFMLGYSAAASTSTTNPYLFFDYIKLEKVTTKDEYIATGITSPTADPQARPIEIYDLNGIRLPSPRRGVNIVKYSDGSVKKILVE